MKNKIKKIIFIILNIFLFYLIIPLIGSIIGIALVNLFFDIF